MDKEKYYIVFYSHCDEGWGYYWGPSIKNIRFANNLVAFSAINLIKNCNEFKWVLDNYNTIVKFLFDFPELKEKLKIASIEGKLEITGVLLIVPAFNIDGESLIRDLMLGRKLFKEAGLKVNEEILFAADVTSHHAQLPQIFSKAGIKYYKLGRPVDALNEKRVPIEFIWEGLDGSRILCNRVFYGSMWINLKNLLAKNTYEEGFEIAYRTLREKIASFYKEPRNKYLVIIGADWQIFHPSICDFIKYLKGKGIDARITTMGEYFKSIDKKRLKIIRGSLDPVGWAANYGVGGDLSRYKILKTVNRLLNSEKISSMAFVLGKKYPEKLYEKAWLYITLNWHHDSSYSYLSDIDFKRQDNILKNTYLSMSKLVLEDAHYIASKINTIDIKGRPIVVFNILPWERTDYATIRVITDKRKANKLRIIDESKNEVSFQVIKREKLSEKIYALIVKFMANVPPLGYSTYQLLFNGSSEKKSYLLRDIVEDKSLRIKIKEGSLKSLYYKPADKELLSTRRYLGNDIVIEKAKFGPQGLTIKEIGPEYKSSDFKFTNKLIKDGSLFTIIRYKGNALSAKISKTIIVHHIKPVVEFKTYIEDLKEGHRFRAIFPLSFNGILTRSIPFGMERYNPANEPYAGEERSNWKLRGVFWSNSWIDYSNSYGLTISNRWRIGYQVNENNISIPLISTVQKEALERFAYPHLLGAGKFTFNYIIIPHKGSVKSSKSYRLVIEWLNPLISIFTSKHFGKLPLRGSIINFENKANSLILSSLFVHNRSLYARIYETEGKRELTRVKVMRKHISIKETDILCNRLIKKNLKEIELKPFEIKTIKLL